MRSNQIITKFHFTILITIFLNGVIFSCDPVTFIGPTVVCPNTTNTYTISGINPSQINFWSIGAVPGSPPFTVICGFQVVSPGTVSLCVAEGFPRLCVYYDNGCEACIDITVLEEPIGDLTGDLQVCGGDTETYTLTPPVSSSLTVTYSVVNGTIISSDNSQVVVQWNNNQTSGQICASVPFCNSTQTVCKTVTINPTPTGNPLTRAECELLSTGQSLFNLGNLSSSVGTGTVTWYNDITLTSPISNPNSFFSGPTTVYATVSNGACTSPPIPITLVVTPNNAALYGMNIVEQSLCGGGTFNVLFTLPAPGVYIYEYKLTCGSNIQTLTITTSANPITFTTQVGCTLEIFKITPQSTLCNAIFSPPLTDNITVVSPPQITVIPGYNIICLGQTIDLSSFLVVSAGTVTWHSSLPPTSGNQLSSTVITPSTSSIYYASIQDQGCTNNVAFAVNVEPVTTPFTVSQTICQNDAAINLNQFLSPPNLAGTWSGQGVSGTTFNPTGLSGSVVLTFDPTDLCLNNGTVTFQINAAQTPTLGTTQICTSADPLDLNTLVDPLFPSGTWTGQGVSANNFNPSNLSGNITLTFTPTTPCTNAATTVINVLPKPTFTVIPNVTVCNASTINLSDYVTADPALLISFHNNLPATSATQIASATITINGNTTFYVKAINSNGCFEVLSISITATPGGIPILGTATLCQTQTTYDLNLLNDPVAGPGTWTGSGVTANVLDLTSQNGIISLSFTPANVCFTVANTTVNINVVTTPVLGDASLCSASGPFNLINLTDPNFTLGSWSGQGVSNNIFNPQMLSGIINLTFTPTAFCVNLANTTINVTPTVIPVLGNAQICETVPSLDLSTLLDPNYPNGTWTGSGVTGNVFNSTGLVGANLLTFTAVNACAIPAQTSIIVNSQQTPTLQTTAICASAAPISLIGLEDPNFLTGIWSGNGVTNNIFDPSGLSGSTTLTFISNEDCTLPAFTSIDVNDAPQLNNFSVDCQPGSNNYIVTFDISGGESTSYSVNGVNTSSSFTSTTIISGNPYIFIVTDANQCAPITIQGSKNCDCISDPGTMSFTNAPLKSCSSDSIRAVFNNNSVLDADDMLRFVLHDNAGLQLGNILATSINTTFAFPPSAILEKTYYISSMIGNVLPNGNIDINDPCFSISAGVPVIFYKPEINIIPVPDFCIETCKDIPINITGVPSYTFIFEILSGNNAVLKDTINSINQNNLIPFCPNQFNINPGEKIFIKILDARDKNCKISEQPFIELKVNPERKKLIDTLLCEGESLTVNGKVYSKSNPQGQEIILSNNPNVCDSIINVDLKFLLSSTFTLNNTICNQQSLIVNGNIYNKDKRSGIEIIPNAVGCDSTITIDLTLVDDIIVNINNNLCADEFILVNGNKYDATRPTGKEIITSGSSDQCDSIINIDLKFLQPKSTTLKPAICADDFITVNNKVYNFSNPKGQEILKNGAKNGCDSIINIELTFIPLPTYNFSPKVCKNESFKINNVTYNFNRPSGTEVLLNGAKSGCDSIVKIALQFNPDSEEKIAKVICQEESIVINGVTFDSNYTNATFTLPDASVNGCDSILNVTISFYPTITDTTRLILNNGQSTVVNGIKFDENYPKGLTRHSDLSQNGCVKYVFVIVTFEQEKINADITTQNETCPEFKDGSITINDISGCSGYKVRINGVTYENITLPFSIKNLAPKSYNLEILGNVGCYFTSTVNVNASPSIGFEVGNEIFEKYVGIDIKIDPNITPTPQSINWIPNESLSCVDCLTPTVSNLIDDFTFEFMLTDNFGCSFEKDLLVKVLKEEVNIIFPNIFSPNGDGINDNFIVLNTAAQRLESIAVYDRWGTLVYTQKDINREMEVLSWDGNLNQQPVSQGIYVFVATITLNNGKEKIVSGDLMIID